MTDECVFCKIVAGAAPAHMVHETEDVLAFLDIRPFSRGHTLVIPKAHASGLADLDPQAGARVFEVAQRVALGLRASDLPAAGVNLMLADGRAANQTVFHVHVHAVPRQHGDQLRLLGKFLRRPAGDLDGVAELVRAGIARVAAG